MPEEVDDALMRRLLAEVRTIAVVGASPRPERPSYGVMQFLKARGYRIVPVNPGQAGRQILGETVYARLADIPEPVDMIDVFRRSEAVAGIVAEALALDARPRAIWTQLGVVDEAAAERARAAGLDVVMDRCPAIEYPRLMRSAGGSVQSSAEGQPAPTAADASSPFSGVSSGQAAPAGWSAPLRSLWLAAGGHWDAAHDLVTDLQSVDAAWVHAHLHRIEGDLDNAAYWYRRAGRPFPSLPLPEEREEIASALLAEAEG